MSALSPTWPRWLGIATINQRLHRQALNVFLLIVLAHWAEHLAQAYQVWVLDRPARRRAAHSASSFRGSPRPNGCTTGTPW
jgi:hypothetical protein